jgi:glutathione peroxidase
MSIHDIKVRTITGEDESLGGFAGKALLIVNVASKCGFTPQYKGLQRVHERYADRGFTVLGFPCNQFGGQEPGTEQEIAEFCELNFGVSFPLFEKIEVNGDNRHELFQNLTQHEDAEGRSGDVGWNFEKFLVAPDGRVVGRFRTMIDPESDDVTAAIEAQLPG